MTHSSNTTKVCTRDNPHCPDSKILVWDLEPFTKLLSLPGYILGSEVPYTYDPSLLIRGFWSLPHVSRPHRSHLDLILKVTDLYLGLCNVTTYSILANSEISRGLVGSTGLWDPTPTKTDLYAPPHSYSFPSSRTVHET